MLRLLQLTLLGVACLRTALAAVPFPTSSMVRIEINIDSEGVRALQQSQRRDVPISIQVDEHKPIHAVAHLKGHGSFRPISEKPSFSIHSVEKNLFGRKKLLLNNSAQDSSFLKWKVASELFRKAGVPAPEIGFARVRLNNRDLGLYLVVEPTDKHFLKRAFGSAKGNLYEGSNSDVADRLELDSGISASAWDDLKILAKACQEPNLSNRWKSLNEILDVERFMSFMAMEVLVGHRDGYSLDRNNFRLYYNPQSARFVFIPHGMDLLFTKANSPLQPAFRGLVASAIVETPQGREAYRSRLQILAKDFSADETLIPRVKALAGLIGPEAGPQHEGEAQALVKAIKTRMEFVRQSSR
jgi:spore coat protein H